MNSEQLTVLGAAIAADQSLAQLVIDRRDDLIAAYYNEPSNPAFIVWRPSVTQDEIMQNGFDWTRVDNLSAGKARIWEWLFSNASRSFNPTKANVRAGIEATWVGTPADLDVRAAVYVHCKRAITRGERLFATGTGSSAVPGLLGSFAGSVSSNDVSAILNAG